MASALFMVVLLAMASSVVLASHPSPLQDFCVADKAIEVETSIDPRKGDIDALISGMAWSTVFSAMKVTLLRAEEEGGVGRIPRASEDPTRKEGAREREGQHQVVKKRRWGLAVSGCEFGASGDNEGEETEEGMDTGSGGRREWRTPPPRPAGPTLLEPADKGSGFGFSFGGARSDVPTLYYEQ
ncbi:hypothetical protein QJS10_CPA09g00991 [Acorus calamus]|uniref:Uncharacterized protein n=1 Tax=Acorus calamus TaxID=4465 RepID=A0AAV9E6C2_ACOCL|nr:hypothetical protein QJS10_CPA09g00991 [Acorus calamus]